MKWVLKVLACLVVGVILGLALSWTTLVRGDFGMVSDGPWKTSLLTNDRDSGPYLRASRALNWLFAAGRDETMTYTAHYDSAGQRLDGNCIYRITGREPNAKWWSLTVYGPDDYLMQNRIARWSITGATVELKPDSSFTINASKTRAPNNWLPVIKGQPFSLTLRLYRPGPGVVMDPGNAMVPSITRAVCV